MQRLVSMFERARLTEETACQETLRAVYKTLHYFDVAGNLFFDDAKREEKMVCYILF